MFPGRPEPESTLDDVVELLAGIGVALMGVSAKLDYIAELLGGGDDEETEP